MWAEELENSNLIFAYYINFPLHKDTYFSSLAEYNLSHVFIFIVLFFCLIQIISSSVHLTKVSPHHWVLHDSLKFYESWSFFVFYIIGTIMQVVKKGGAVLVQSYRSFRFPNLRKTCIGKDYHFYVSNTVFWTVFEQNFTSTNDIMNKG